MDAVLTTIRVVLALIRGDWDGAWDLIVGYLKRSWNRITSFLKGDALAAIKAAISILIGGVKTALDYLVGTGEGTLIGDVKGIFGSIASWLEGTGKSLFSDAFSAVADAITKALEVNIDWPEPPTIVKKAANGTLGDDIDWPSLPGGGGGGGPILGGGPLLDTGGFVESTGRAVIHEGEEIVPEAEVDRDRGGSGSRPVTADITVYAQDGTDAGQQIADEMDRFL
jgi:Flp pilus assembly pilin Flp